MRGVFIKVILAIFAISSGCTLGIREHRSYSAKIIDVRDNPGEFYSVEKGHKPLFSLYISVENPRPGIGSEMFEIQLLDDYSPRAYGRAGDKVSFDYDGMLPADGTIFFESISNYKIVARGG